MSDYDCRPLSPMPESVGSSDELGLLSLVPAGDDYDFLVRWALTYKEGDDPTEEKPPRVFSGDFFGSMSACIEAKRTIVNLFMDHLEAEDYAGYSVDVAIRLMERAIRCLKYKSTEYVGQDVMDVYVSLPISEGGGNLIAIGLCVNEKLIDVKLEIGRGSDPAED